MSFFINIYNAEGLIVYAKIPFMFYWHLWSNWQFFIQKNAK